ncbi:MAG: gliding motility-associated C-terminal domain-containing protein [Bacteroidetes bacterium]|nr:gliding motility-associated C-terminal domain-containing protein [Bacteroidota bacterium]
MRAQSLYWVGGSGHFNDAAHWSFSSGGLGGAKTPTLNDDVFFDEKSGTSSSIVSIIGGANCHNITFSNNTQPITLQGTQNERLSIAGSASFNLSVKNNFLGDVWFQSSEQSNILKLGSFIFSGNVYFDGGGSWNVSSNFNTEKNKTVFVNAATIAANNTSFFLGNLICNSGAQILLNNTMLWIQHRVTSLNNQQIQGTGTSKLFFDYALNTHHFSNITTQNSGSLRTMSTTTIVNIQSPTCNGGCNGQATVTGINGTPPYTIQWISSTPQTYTTSATTFTCVGLCANSYNVLITCTTSSGDSTTSFLSGVNVPATSPISIPPPSTTPATCNGLCNGSSSYIIAGSHPPYTVVWTTPSLTTFTLNNVPSGITQTTNSLCAGTYTINVTDAAGCTMQPSVKVTINQPPVISPNGGVKAPLCFGACNGQMWVAPTGGTPFGAVQSNGIKYTTTWDSGNTNDTLYNLCAGSVHTCTVTDKNGCTAVYTGTVPAAPPALAATINPVTTTSISCANVCNGSVSVTGVSGGTNPYTFSWTPTGGVISGSANSSTYSSLCAGTYSCVIKDAHGCVLSETFTLTSPPPITHTVTVVQPKCNGQASGSITDAVSGGTPLYTGFVWAPSGVGTISGTATSSTYSNLPFGTYSVVLTDSRGCHDTVKATLNNPPVLNATVTFTNPACFGSTDGQICVSPSGGTGATYTYSWSPAEPATACVSGLGAGVYSITVKDSNNCVKAVSATLTSPPQITAVVAQKNASCATLCNASATVTPSGGVPGYTYSWSCAPGNNTPTLSGQCGNTTCTVTITDSKNCSVTKAVTFTKPNPLIINISATPLVCANQCNAQINTSVTGGTPTYIYSWSGTGANPVSPTAPSQSNMCSGNYSVTVTDSSLCTTTATVSIANPAPIVIATTSINPNCSGACDGSISAAITGGTFPTYTFIWNPAMAPNTLTPNNLCAGTYVLNVNDANNCLASQTVTLVNPTPITASVTPTNVTCAGSCNGSAVAMAAGGTAPYQYSWDGGIYSATASTSGLCTGTHTLQVKDSKGCIATAIVYNITQPTALSASVSNVTKSCLNICNGTATAGATGGTAPYQFSWDAAGGPFSSATTINTLCVGTHTLYVKDANGCLASTVFNVQVIINVNILASSLSVSCHNACDGSANATASGGSAPYTFSWTPNPVPVPACSNTLSCTANNLCPGTYIVFVTDQTGCASKDSITILNPPALTATTSVVNATCFGSCNGSAAVVASGGTAPYTYSWSNNGVIGPNPTNLCPGSYTATVVDSRGCTTNNPITVSSSPQYTIAPTVTSPSTCLSNSGSISLAISGGTPSYTVTWNTGSHANPLTGLAAGIYTATISDSKGCDTTVTIGVHDPNGPVTNVVINNNASCFGVCNGSATVSGTSANPPVTVIWTTGTPSGPSPQTDNTLCGGPVSAPDIYPVKVVDALGCVSIATVSITEPNKIVDNATVTPSACSSGNTGSITLSPSGGTSPYSYAVDGTATTNPITGLASGTHTVVITDASGCTAAYIYNINAPTTVAVSITKTNVLCSGLCNGTAQAAASGGFPAYTYTWTNSSGSIISNSPNVAGLCSGNYTLTVADAHSCSIQTVVTINPATPIAPNFVKQDNNCSTGCTGTASVAPTGGSGGGFTYNWNTPGNPTTTSVSALCPGNYFVIVKDTNHCTDTTHFTISAPPSVSVSVTYTSPTCFGYANGSASVTPSGGTPTYTVSWSPNICVGCASTHSLTAQPYIVSVTDSKGCTNSTTFVLKDSAKMHANAVATSPLCSGSCNGSITATPSGGNGGYNYQWQGIAPSPGNNPTASGLCPGTYTLIVVDSKNCRDTVSTTVNSAPAIVLNESQTAATCGQSNGSITINTVTPSGALTVNWLSPIACGTNVACTNLSAGIYTVVLSNTNNCKDTFQIGITNSNGPLVTLTTDNVTCFGSCNGSATVTVIHPPNNPPYSYNWNTIPPVSTTTVSGLCGSPPNYISTVTDGLSCQTLTTFSIAAPPKIMDNPTIVNATCAGINNGSITSHGMGGTPYAAGYMYSLDGASYSFSNVFNNLAMGTHTVCIKDSLGCSNCFNYTINGSTFITSSLASTNNMCYGVCNATATLSNIIGGAPPYLIAWSNGQAGSAATNLCAGTYTATITDTMGCKVSQIATITAPSTSVSPNYSVTQPACGMCNGIINLAPTGGNGGAYTYTWSTTANTASINNACAGLYQVNIADVMGCISSYLIPVNNSTSPTAAITSTGLTCSGVCNATASVTASGGTAPYSYNWVSPSSASPSINNLCAGTYYVQVKDAANCVTTQSVSIAPPPSPIVISKNVIPTQCGKCDGSVTYTATGGTGSYSYTWNGVSTGSTAQNNLCAGIYTLVVTSGACSQTVAINMNSSNAPLVTISVGNPTCSGLSNGSATATILGGAPPVTTSWSNGSTANPDVNLGAGTYQVTVTDNNGCASVQTFTVTAPTALAVSLSNTQLPSCSSVCNGVLTAIPSGGTMPYTYTWSPGATHADTLGSLCAGNYAVNVADANGCSVSQNVNLINNPFLINPNPTITPPNCAQCNGTISLAPTGGATPYTYTWTTAPVNNTNQINNVCAGVYQVDVTDGKGCSQLVQIPVSSIASPSITVNASNVTCNGLSNGSATATATGGTTPYVYSWTPVTPAVHTPTIGGLSANIYFIQVADALGCIATQSVDIAQPALLNANAIISTPSCGVCNGSISTNVSGGIGPYTYLWSANAASATTPTVGSLCGGIYTVQVTDAGTSCTNTLTIGLNNTNGPALTIASTGVSCYGMCNGSATVTASGGTPAYSYSWSPSALGTSPAVSNLCANTNYLVAVGDAAGCVQTKTLTITPPSRLILSLATTTPIKCNNNANGAFNAVVSGGTPVYTYSWAPSTASGQNPSGLAAGVYSLVVTDANGCSANQTDTLKNPPKITLAGDTISATCNNAPNGAITTTVTGGVPSYTYSWSNGAATPNLTNILPGHYTLTVTDTHGCTLDTNFVVASTVSITVNAGRDTVMCTSGSITLTGTVTGSPTYNWQDISGTLIPPANSLTITVNPSASTQYVLIATYRGCTNSDTVLVSISPNAGANAGPSQSIMTGQSVNIGGTPTNPGGGSTIWRPPYGLSDTTVANPVASPTITTTYSVYVTNAFGCVGMDSMIVTVLPPFTIPTGFTPNGDGHNDIWLLDYISLFPNVEIEVYNRWGEQLFYSKGNYVPWNGTYKGSPVPVGTYYYIIRLNDPKYPDHYAGPLTILR